MKLKGVWKALLVLAALAASSCEEQQSAPLAEQPLASMRTTEQEARSQNKVLVLGSSVAGGLASREAQAAAALGYPVDVVTPEQWSLMLANDFMLYRAIIIGDAACQAGTAAFDAAVANS
ncbi:MAG: hypothetical protein JXB05_05965, partial [Myxococcaceae bacterium]|nr:hypothetical protein [Myxococcaceae bacterium]